MERKEAVKLEGGSIQLSAFSDGFPAGNSLTGMLDLCNIEGRKSSLGFMELLGIQDFTPSIFDVFSAPESLAQTSAAPPEILNQPMTPPNSSSISSASSGGPSDEQSKNVDEDYPGQQKPKIQLKPKKTCQKSEKEPRFAFMTKSEVDHLEDGYRWRKYGQKAVKNSPFPRSYYRCTKASCNVKKRVERSLNDTSIVVTTYQGKHTHPSPVMPCQTSGRLGRSGNYAPTFSLPIQVLSLPHHEIQSQFNNLNSSCGYLNYTNPTACAHDRRFSTPASALLTDHGLLQDIVPSTMIRKDEQI